MIPGNDRPNNKPTPVGIVDYENINATAEKNSKKTVEAVVPDNQRYFHFCKTGIVKNSKTYYTNLFTTPFYYNQVSDEAKALLFLHTLPYDYQNVVKDNFKDKGGIEILPYGYLLFIGGLMWRKKYSEEKKSDPIKYDLTNAGSKTPICCPPLSPDTPLLKKEGFVIYLNGTNKPVNDYMKYNDVVKFKDNPWVEMSLIVLFKNFVKNEFQKIKTLTELKYKISENSNGVLNSTYAIELCKRSDKDYKYQLELLCGRRYVEGTYNASGYEYRYQILNFKDNYIFGYIKNNIFYSFFPEKDKNGNDAEIQVLLKDIFYREVMICIMPTRMNKIKKSILKSYFNGYAKAIEYYLKNDLPVVPATSTTPALKASSLSPDEEARGDERDLKCAIYLALKNVWDRWLCGYFYQEADENGVNGKEFFEVKNFFENNFIFIDSFYRNIYNRHVLNCNTIADTFLGGNNEKTGIGKNTVNHLGSIAAKHKCMMFNFPDNINFSKTPKKGDGEFDSSAINDGDGMLEELKAMFTPMPANKIGKPDVANKFVCIYANAANRINDVKSEFIPDTFDIWSADDGTGVAPNTFSSQCEGFGDDGLSNSTRMGYNVPAFGVAYSRQNNSYWKNIKVGMDNMTITEQVIRAEAYMVEQANPGQKKLCYYGQDIYSLYQLYSYIVTVEMMGDAQIQPLMYFQLMNIPMFRGTYMVISVEHKITQGNMTTTFSGMKISRTLPPQVTSWFISPSKEESEGTFISPNTDQSNNGEEIIAVDGTVIDIADNKLSKAIKCFYNNDENKIMSCDDFVIGVYGKLGRKIKNGLLYGE